MVDPELAPLAVGIFVEDVAEGASFYAGTLGFNVTRTETAGDEPIFAIAHLGETVFMFMHDRFHSGTRADLDYRGASINVRVMVPDVDAVYERSQAAAVDVMTPIGDRDDGLRDFIMRDPFGFQLRFSSPLT